MTTLFLPSMTFALLALLTVSGCLSAPPPQKQPEHRVDIKAQQVFYDQGLQHYSRENYQAAQESFERVVDNGPGTILGLKAQENLKKLHQILKTLENMQSK